ncbi:hypothetical protein [Nocardia sp. CC227C]|uniref:hypothetical protein n=1 Tax=Nocardia sp. CC227C TaxID=3044562 RepID=UPI00278C8E78|nr:hypothetical protein [Nocardia sp. CC227C]
MQRHNIQGGIKADGAGRFSERWVNPDFTPTREYLGGSARIRFNPGTRLSARLPGNDLLFWTCELTRAEAIAQGVDPAALFGPPSSTGTPA